MVFAAFAAADWEAGLNLRRKRPRRRKADAHRLKHGAGGSESVLELG